MGQGRTHQHPDTVNAKRIIRKEKLLWRSSLPHEEALTKSEQIAANLKRLPEYSVARTILFYVSAKGNEVNTHTLIGEALDRGIRVLVPVTDFDRKRLIISEIKSFHELAPARFGLLEPPADALRPIDPNEADVIIVPGVAFDTQCRRLGFGGGYYDRLLSTVRAPAVALSYEGQFVDRVPVSSTDISVDIIVTETRVYRRLT
ncbi:MAG: 5-formyltetrahydrofolate cyclo-ligase [Candidatus Abyssubacteria bacterium]